MKRATVSQYPEIGPVNFGNPKAFGLLATIARLPRTFPVVIVFSPGCSLLLFPVLPRFKRSERPYLRECSPPQSAPAGSFFRAGVGGHFAPELKMDRISRLLLQAWKP